MRDKRCEGLNQKKDGEREGQSRKRYAALNGHEALRPSLIQNACRKMPIMTPVGGQVNNHQQQPKYAGEKLTKEELLVHP